MMKHIFLCLQLEEIKMKIKILLMIGIFFMIGSLHLSVIAQEPLVFTDQQFIGEQLGMANKQVSVQNVELVQTGTNSEINTLNFKGTDSSVIINDIEYSGYAEGSYIEIQNGEVSDIYVVSETEITEIGEWSLDGSSGTEFQSFEGIESIRTLRGSTDISYEDFYIESFASNEFTNIYPEGSGLRFTGDSFQVQNIDFLSPSGEASAFFGGDGKISLDSTSIAKLNPDGFAEMKFNEGFLFSENPAEIYVQRGSGALPEFNYNQVTERVFNEIPTTGNLNVNENNFVSESHFVQTTSDKYLGQWNSPDGRISYDFNYDGSTINSGGATTEFRSFTNLGDSNQFIVTGSESVAGKVISRMIGLGTRF